MVFSEIQGQPSIFAVCKSKSNLMPRPKSSQHNGWKPRPPSNHRPEILSGPGRGYQPNIMPVDGRNPAPPENYQQTMVSRGVLGGAGFCPYSLSDSGSSVNLDHKNHVDISPNSLFCFWMALRKRKHTIQPMGQPLETPIQTNPRQSCKSLDSAQLLPGLRSSASLAFSSSCACVPVTSLLKS